MPQQPTEYGFGSQGSPARTRRKTPSGGRRSASPAQLPPPVLDPEREARKQERVKRGLERIQEMNQVAEEGQAENGHHNNGEEAQVVPDIIEFAENFFNDHEKSPQVRFIHSQRKFRGMKLKRD